MPCIAKWEAGAPELEKYIEDGVEGLIFLKKTIAGSPAYFVNGNLFAGTQGYNIFIRLDNTDRDRLINFYGNSLLLEPVTERTEKEYIAVPIALYSGREAFRYWVKRSYGYAAALPPRIGIFDAAPRPPAAKKRHG